MKLRIPIKCKKRERERERGDIKGERRKGVKILKNRKEGARPRGSCHPCTLLKPVGGSEVPSTEGGKGGGSFFDCLRTDSCPNLS